MLDSEAPEATEVDRSHLLYARLSGLEIARHYERGFIDGSAVVIGYAGQSAEALVACLGAVSNEYGEYPDSFRMAYRAMNGLLLTINDETQLRNIIYYRKRLFEIAQMKEMLCSGFYDQIAYRIYSTWAEYYKTPMKLELVSPYPMLEHHHTTNGQLEQALETRPALYQAWVREYPGVFEQAFIQPEYCDNYNGTNDCWFCGDE